MRILALMLLGVVTATAAPHWSYVAPELPAPPAVTDADWPKNPIDRFTLARMEAAGLAPEAQADPARLLQDDVRVAAQLVYEELAGDRNAK